MNILNPLTADAKDLQDLLENGAVKSVDLVKIYLNQIQKHDGYLKAMICMAPTEKAMNAARGLDQERSAGKLRSALHGIPIVIKDNIDTHPDLGMKTTAGSYALVDSLPHKNAEIVDKLIAAGLIVLGKCNLSVGRLPIKTMPVADSNQELSDFKGEGITGGWSAVGGQTQSAYVRGHVDPNEGLAGHSNPGASSAGSAVAVSAGYAPFSLGTETHGSLIIPAGRAALYTIKPTIGLLSQDGLVPISHTFDSAGPMAKTPYDLAVLLDVMADRHFKRSDESYTSVLTSQWNDISIGTLSPEEWPFPVEWCRPVWQATEQMNREIRGVYARLKGMAKCVVDGVPLPHFGPFFLDDKYSVSEVMDADFVQDINRYLEQRIDCRVRNLEELIYFNYQHSDKELPAYAPNQKALIRAYGQIVTPEQYARFLQRLRYVARNMGIDHILEKYKVDVIIGPTDSFLMTYATCSGYPIATLPLSYLEYNGRPFGLAVIAKAHQEALLIKVQSAWEATFGLRKPPPALDGRRRWNLWRDSILPLER